MNNMNNKNNMKSTILIWIAAVVFIVAAIIVTSLPSNKGAKINASTSSTSPTSGPVQPVNSGNFRLNDLSGKSVSLSDFKGRPVYINFFATWCPPCRGEMPEIESLYQKYKSQGLVVLAVDLQEDAATVQNFITQNGYTFNVLLDTNGETNAFYDLGSIPVSVFVDKAGNIVERQVGAMDRATMEANIKKIM
ncbi:MAG: redoxin family protein [Bacillota bacterium]